MATSKLEKATFAAGCFWHVEAEFKKIHGVVSTAAGYMGGHMDNPTYEDVCTDSTGHAEVCQVEFDPEIVSYEKLLNTFWNMHNPTTMNRQGPDVGTQYRSTIFYHNEKQKASAIKSKEKLKRSGKYKSKIVTEIIKASNFYKAEEYHQQYLEKRRIATCRI